MKTLIELFETPNLWIIELNNRAIYNEPILNKDGFYYYVYCWVNLETQWCYVGKHKSDNPYNTENYIGSCRNPYYERSRKLHPFDFIILGYYTSESVCLEAEASIIDKSFIAEYKNKGLFNLKPGGKGVWSEEATKASMDPQAIEKRVQADKNNHGGIMGWHTPESLRKRLENSNSHEAIKARLESNRRNHGGVEAFNTPEAHNRSELSRLLNPIIKTLDKLHELNLDITLENYNKYRVRTVISTIKSNIDRLRKDSRWTQEMELLFSNDKTEN
jgi:hypothetical protein